MACALPYHATLQFVRLAQTLKLPGTWAWLGPMQRSGAPLPRPSLVQRCLTDAAVLQHVCAAAAQQAAVPARLGARGVSATWMSFYAILVCEVIAAAPRVRCSCDHVRSFGAENSHMPHAVNTGTAGIMHSVGHSIPLNV